jgi:hypothetical protein
VRRLSFLGPARREAERERAYYERAAGLGDDFIAELAVVLESIRRMPETSSVVETVRGEAVRRVLLERFPFKVVYVVRSRLVLVVAIAHTSRHPDYWKFRLRR